VRKLALALFVASLLPGALTHARTTPVIPEAALVQVQQMLAAVPLIDGHNDLPWQLRKRTKGQLGALDLRVDQRRLPDVLHTDLPRLREGGVGGVFWSVYVPADLGRDEAVRATLEQIDLVHRLVDTYPDVLGFARTADDLERLHREGRIASLIGMEGAHSIGDSLAVLRSMYALGARYMTLTHVKTNAVADAATDKPRHGGLSPFGRRVVREMNRLGMLVDLSHVSPAAMHAALDVSLAPVLFSHSSARAICDHVRNVPDDVLVRLRDNGGVVLVTFVPSYLDGRHDRHHAAARAERARLEALHPGDPERTASDYEVWQRAHPAPVTALRVVADHIDHIRAVAGIDHVGLGSDFDGMNGGPRGLEDTSGFPALFVELLRRGYTPEELQKIAGLNVLRVLRAAEGVAARLRAEGARPDDTAFGDEVEPTVP